VFAIVNPITGTLSRFDFGAPLEPPRDPEAHLRWVLADYDARRDEQWQIAPPAGEAVLAKIARSSGQSPAELLPLIRAFAFYAMPDEGPYLVGPLTRHPDAAVQRAAIRALGSMGAHDGLAYVWPFLQSPDPVLRREAVIATGKFGLPDAIPYLDAAAAGDPGLVALAARGRRRIEAVRSKDLDQLVDVVITTEDYEELGVLTPFLYQPVAMVLVDPARPEIERLRAARLLGLARVRKIAAVLRVLLGDPTVSLPLRIQLVIALGRIRDGGAVTPLLGWLGDPDPTLQDAVITALGQIGDRRAFGPLLNRFGDRGGAVRERVRLAASRLAAPLAIKSFEDWSLGKINLDGYAVYFFDDALGLAPELDRAFIDRALADPRPAARREAALLLALFGGPLDAPRLAAMVQRDADDLVRRVAAHGEAKLRAKQTAP
jgi:HEAT repeat protein